MEVDLTSVRAISLCGRDLWSPPPCEGDVLHVNVTKRYYPMSINYNIKMGKIEKIGDKKEKNIRTILQLYSLCKKSGLGWKTSSTLFCDT